jgi:hypothetical protein
VAAALAARGLEHPDPEFAGARRAARASRPTRSTPPRRSGSTTRAIRPAHGRIELPEHSGFTAWAESGNGTWIALGDNEGRVFVIEYATRAVRRLPTPMGKDIAWLAFSEDGAWLAVAGMDGAAYAFDVASGNPLAGGEMRHDFALERVAIDRRQRLLIAAGVGRTALWRLPDPSPQALEPRRCATSPTPEPLAGEFGVAWSLGSGLLATGRGSRPGAPVAAAARLRAARARLAPARGQPALRRRAHRRRRFRPGPHHRA